jgi:hypothetical protein
MPDARAVDPIVRACPTRSTSSVACVNLRTNLRAMIASEACEGAC